MKKLLCAILAICFLFSTFALPAQAATDELYGEMYVLRDNGIIKGDPDGALRPESELTRAEFATILCRAAGIDKLAETADMADKGYFDDVPSSHWAAGYINAAVEYDAINGFGDGTFRPELTVTNEQVIKMLVAAWGYTEQAEALGGYPNGYMAIARRYGVTDAVMFNYGIASKRWVACAFVYGALSMPVAESSALEIPFDVEPMEDNEEQPENTTYI